MTQINLRRLILGGLLAGLLFNVLGMVSAMIVDLESVFRRVGWTPQAYTLFLHLGMRFGLGIVGVFLYAAMRPRFGAGPKTAIIAGAAMWFVGYLLPLILMTELGIFTTWQGTFGVIWGLAESCVAVTAGAWVYSEPA